ncbi:MAG: hypothetical protein K8T90_20210 [Planctomycetes bacterium]|nr:hypothetical protein [Planctomycetota bacterium]
MQISNRHAAVIIGTLLLVVGLAVPYMGGWWREEQGIENANDVNVDPPPSAAQHHDEFGPAGGSAGAGGSAPGAQSSGSGTASTAAPAAAPEPMKKKAVPNTGLALRVQVLDREPRDGEPVRARIRLENVGRTAVVVCDPQLDLGRRVEMLYRHQNINYCATFPSGPMKPLDTTQLIEMRPGDGIDAFVDLRPLLDSALGFGEGPFQFRMAYRGATGVIPAAVRAWNGDPAQVATSDELRVVSSVPAWFEDLGGDGELLNSLASRIFLWAPGSPEDDAVLDHVRSLGEPAVGALAIVASRMASPGPSAQIRARKALLMLRHLGAEVLPVLRRAPQTPAVAAAIAMAEDDARERTALGPSDASRVFRAIGGGTRDGTTFSVSVMRSGGIGSVCYSFDAEGRVFVTRWKDRDAQETALLPLDTDRVVELKRAILRNRPWTWQPVRAEARAGEGEVGFSLADGTGSMVWLQSFRGSEAREGNPFTADVLRAFRLAAGDADDATSSPTAPSAALETRK